MQEILGKFMPLQFDVLFSANVLCIKPSFSQTTGMSEAGGQGGGSCPPRFWRIRRRRRAAAARRITTCPTGFLTLAASLKSNHEMHGS